MQALHAHHEEMLLSQANLEVLLQNANAQAQDSLDVNLDGPWETFLRPLVPAVALPSASNVKGGSTDGSFGASSATTAASATTVSTSTLPVAGAASTASATTAGNTVTPSPSPPTQPLNPGMRRLDTCGYILIERQSMSFKDREFVAVLAPPDSPERFWIFQVDGAQVVDKQVPTSKISGRFYNLKSSTSAVVSYIRANEASVLLENLLRHDERRLVSPVLDEDAFEPDSVTLSINQHSGLDALAILASSWPRRGGK